MSKLTVIEQATEYLELSQKRMVYDESTHIIASLLSLLEEKESIGFWKLHERYEEKVSKCLDQADEIKRLNGILEEKDKALAFYADESNYDQNEDAMYPEILDDRGDIARKALNTSSNNEGETK